MLRCYDYCRCCEKLFSENIIISVSLGEKAVGERIGEAVRKYGNIKRNRENIGVVNVLNNSNMLFTSERCYHGKIEKFFNIYKFCCG